MISSGSEGEGQTWLTRGPFAGKSYAQVLADESEDGKSFKDMVRKGKARMPDYQKPFRSNLLASSSTQESPDGCNFQAAAGSTRTTIRYKCTRCGNAYSEPRPRERALLDPATCPHENITRLGSSKKYVNYFCMDCETSVHKVSDHKQLRPTKSLRRCY